MRLIKVENGIFDGECLYNANVKVDAAKMEESRMKASLRLKNREL